MQIGRLNLEQVREVTEHQLVVMQFGLPDGGIKDVLQLGVVQEID